MHLRWQPARTVNGCNHCDLRILLPNLYPDRRGGAQASHGSANLLCSLAIHEESHTSHQERKLDEWFRFVYAKLARRLGGRFWLIRSRLLIPISVGEFMMGQYQLKRFLNSSNFHYLRLYFTRLMTKFDH